MNEFLIFRVPRVHAWIRRWCPYLLLGGAVGSVALVPDRFVIHMIVSWAAIAIAMTVWAHTCSTYAANKYDGRVVDFIFAPTPMGSLCAALSKQGVSVDDIASIKLMSSDLAQTKEYLAKGRSGDEPFLQIVERCPDMRVWYYGWAEDAAIESGHRRIVFVPINDKLIEHTNLVKTKRGDSYVWYEPAHQLINGEDCFGGGGYLIELTPEGERQVEAVFSDLSRKRRTQPVAPKEMAYA